jgi:hypothetical protein
MRTFGFRYGTADDRTRATKSSLAADQQASGEPFAPLPVAQSAPKHHAVNGVHYDDKQTVFSGRSMQAKAGAAMAAIGRVAVAGQTLKEPTTGFKTLDRHSAK